MAESGRALDILEQITGAIGSTDTTERDSFIFITRDHHKIHDGKYYTAKVSNSTVASSSWLELEMVTPSTAIAEIHLYIDSNFSAGMTEVVLAELSTSSTYAHGATGVTAINHNRLSTNSATMAIFYGSTNNAFLTSTMTSTQAVLLDNQYVGSTGTKAGRTGAGGERNQDEYVLKGNSTNIVRMYNRADANGAGTLSLYWYETI